MELQSRRLVQLGIALVLAAALIGLAVPHLPVPRLALSAHVVGLLQGMFLVVMGLAWPRLTLTPAQARLAFGLFAYQAIAAPSTNFLGAVWGAGNTIIPMAAGAAHGTAAQEVVMNIGLRSAGAALIAALALSLWGLRGRAT